MRVVFLFVMWLAVWLGVVTVAYGGDTVPFPADDRDALVGYYGSRTPVRSAAPVESDWTLDTDGSYVRNISRRTTAKTTASTTPQTRTQSVPAVTQVPFGVRTTAPVAVVPSTVSPVLMQTVPTRTVAPRAVRRGGISFGVSAGACVGGG